MTQKNIDDVKVKDNGGSQLGEKNKKNRSFSTDWQ
jgi:hypothetical protein